VFNWLLFHSNLVIKQSLALLGSIIQWTQILIFWLTMDFKSTPLFVQPAFSLMDIFRLSLTQLSISIIGRKLGFKPYNQDYRVCYGDDLAYLFPRVGLPNGIKTPLQLLTRERLVDFVASFAKNNKPLAEDLEQEVWEALDPEKGEHLQIGEKVEMFRDPEWRRQMEFWKKIKQKVAKTRLPNFLSSQPISLLFRNIAIKRVNAL